MESLHKIEHWSKTFGLPVGVEDMPDHNRLTLALNLIEEEFNELTKAVEYSMEKGEFTPEVPDGLGDLLWVVVRAFMEMGFDVEKVIAEIYKSNMSKICPTKEEAQATVKGYAELGFDTYYEEVSDGFIVKDSKTHKVKKYFGWSEPNFTDLQNFRIFNDKS